MTEIRMKTPFSRRRQDASRQQLRRRVRRTDGRTSGHGGPRRAQAPRRIPTPKWGDSPLVRLPSLSVGPGTSAFAVAENYPGDASPQAPDDLAIGEEPRLWVGIRRCASAPLPTVLVPPQ